MFPTGATPRPVIWLGRRRFRINIHLDTGGAWLHQGPTLPSHVLYKICCDCEDDGVLLRAAA